MLRVGEPYRGNLPRRVGKSARYTVTADGEIRLRYQLGRREHTLLTTRDHDALVDMVDEVKDQYAGARGGAFYINEFRHVLVPIREGDTAITYFGGTYVEDLEFEFEGKIIGPRGPGDLEVGDLWEGPLVGIRYAVGADGRDVYYEYESRPRVTTRVLLSDYRNGAEILRLLEGYRRDRGAGGRLYVNEAGIMFGPVGDSLGSLQYRYYGQIELAAWFPDPLLS